MLKPQNNTTKLLTSTEEKIMEKLIKPEHIFRKLNQIVDFEAILNPYRSFLYSETGTVGIDLLKGFKSLLIQFWENYSDREMEKALQENVSVKWFCGFELTEETPDHTYFCKLRKRLGTENMANLFNNINETLNERGLFGNVFSFIDASSIITKTALWEERDKAIEDGEKKLNNANIEKYAADKDARWGAKGKNKIWFGYKRHHAVDMRFGLIAKVDVTPANIPDFRGIKNIIPKQGMSFLDKGYDYQEVDDLLKTNNCHPAIIRKNNNQNKNKDLDRWISAIRMPFEGTFSKLRKRAKFKGKTKVLFQCLFEAMSHNLKKAVTILPMQTLPV